MISVGQRVRFDSLATIKCGIEKMSDNVVGTVIWINEPHGWFSVRYGNNLRTSFFFTEIGKTVHICK